MTAIDPLRGKRMREAEKALFWIDGSDQRFSGYNDYGSHPERLVGWFDRHLRGPADAG